MHNDACPDILYSHHPEYGNLLLVVLIIAWVLLPTIGLE